MIAAQQEKVLGVLDFVAQKEANCFDRLLAAVNIVPQEQIVGLGRETAVLKDPEQIIVLSMHITYFMKRKQKSVK